MKSPDKNIPLYRKRTPSYAPAAFTACPAGIVYHALCGSQPRFYIMAVSHKLGPPHRLPLFFEINVLVRGRKPLLGGHPAKIQCNPKGRAVSWPAKQSEYLTSDMGHFIPAISFGHRLTTQHPYFGPTFTLISNQNLAICNLQRLYSLSGYNCYFTKK
ncbi:MAG: hypothetical protein WCD70_02505 [Alphaproteobacteria bacterium]